MPGFAGIGISTTYSMIYLALYYIMLMTYAMHYFLSSFQSPLPWREGFRQILRNHSSLNNKTFCRKIKDWYFSKINFVINLVKQSASSTGCSLISLKRYFCLISNESGLLLNVKKMTIFLWIFTNWHDDKCCIYDTLW